MSVINSCSCCSAALLTSTSSRPNLLDRLLRPRPGRTPRRRCRRRGQALPALAPHRLGRLRASSCSSQIDDGDVGALAREQHRHRPADAAVAAGDDRHLAGEPSRTRVAGPIFRARVHLRLAAGLVRLRLAGHSFLAAMVSASLVRGAQANNGPSQVAARPNRCWRRTTATSSGLRPESSARSRCSNIFAFGSSLTAVDRRLGKETSGCTAMVISWPPAVTREAASSTTISPGWRTFRDKTKFGRMLAFGQALPRIRAAVEAELAKPGLGQHKVLATVVRLLETTLIRIGNDEYARANKIRTDHDTPPALQGGGCPAPLSLPRQIGQAARGDLVRPAPGPASPPNAGSARPGAV